MVIIGVFVLAIGAAALMYFANPKANNSSGTPPVAIKNTQTPEPTNTSVTPTSVPSALDSAKPTMSEPANKYKNGSFKATGSYVSPAGAESIELDLTLDGDVVTSVEFKGNASNPVSKNLQQKFSEGFKDKVVGKQIDSIALTVVNGASLVPKGFMDALTKIKADAKPGV